jgi:hypothetical protein
MHPRNEVPSGAGRVEPVVSGRSVEFASLAEVGRFMRRTAARADRGLAVAPRHLDKLKTPRLEHAPGWSPPETGSAGTLSPP